MKINFLNFKTKKIPKFSSLVKKNPELTSLISTALIVIILIQIFNFIKEERKQTLFKILNNIYFEKTLTSIFKNLDPKYLNVEHKINSGDTFDQTPLSNDFLADLTAKSTSL